MMAGSHVIFGSAVWLYAASHFGLPVPAAAVEIGLPVDPLSLSLAMLGSLAPDIDHPKSVIGRRVKLISVPLSWLFGHRGLTHSSFAIAACLWALRSGHLSPELITPFTVGYLSHLAGDFFTPSGLSLMYPLRKRRTFAFPLFKTGGFCEQVAVTLSAGWMLARAMGTC